MWQLYYKWKKKDNKNILKLKITLHSLRYSLFKTILIFEVIHDLKIITGLKGSETQKNDSLASKNRVVMTPRHPNTGELRLPGFQTPWSRNSLASKHRGVATPRFPNTGES